ncbi:MAG: hypothetical protein ACRC8A_11060 [Microcoleaceae cyanobacterium]
MKFDWKAEIQANQEPLRVGLPKKGKSMMGNIQDLKNAIATFAPKIQFVTEQATANLWRFLIIEFMGISRLIYVGTKGGNLFTFLLWFLGALLFIVYTLVTLVSDLGHLGFWLSPF